MYAANRHRLSVAQMILRVTKLGYSYVHGFVFVFVRPTVCSVSNYTVWDWMCQNPLLSSKCFGAQLQCVSCENSFGVSSSYIWLLPIISSHLYYCSTQSQERSASSNVFKHSNLGIGNVIVL